MLKDVHSFQRLSEPPLERCWKTLEKSHGSGRQEYSRYPNATLEPASFTYHGYASTLMTHRGPPLHVILCKSWIGNRLASRYPNATLEPASSVCFWIMQSWSQYRAFLLDVANLEPGLSVCFEMCKVAPNASGSFKNASACIRIFNKCFKIHRDRFNVLQNASGFCKNDPRSFKNAS